MRLETPLPYCINSRLDQFSSAAYDPDILNRTVFPDQRFHHHWSFDPLQPGLFGILGHNARQQISIGRTGSLI